MKTPLPRSTVLTAAFVFLTTSLVWFYSVTNHNFLMSEIWFYLIIFFVPALLVCGCSWLIIRKQMWLRAVGGVLLLPSVGVWVLSLLLVYAGFKIH